MEEKNVQKRKSLILWVTLALILLAIACGLFWLFYLRFHETTDDAYANGNLVNINSAVTGSVIAFYADDTDLVKEGQLLVELDSTEYRVTYERELASLASLVLQVREIYDNVNVYRAALENKKVALAKARFDYENRLNLIETLAVSNEDFIHSKDDLSSAELDVQQATYQLQTAIDAAGNTAIENHPRIEVQKGVIREAYYKLARCAIYAPTTGFVAQRRVDVGESVTQTTNLMAIIPKDYVWVDANFKETQLRHMRIGQKARVTFDLYGSSVKFEGKVLGMASGTGSVFSLIPPQNATGNWIKIVQRLPVRISLDPETVCKYPTRLGISANVNVDISERDLPRLAEIPAKKVVDSTSVFDLDFEGVEKLMDEIICKNLI